MTYISLPHWFLTWKGAERNQRGKKDHITGGNSLKLSKSIDVLTRRSYSSI